MINRESINGAFITSVIAIAIAAIVLLSSVPSLFSAMFASSQTKGDPKKEITALVGEHEDVLSTYQARFTGRSVFYRPQPYPQPRRDPPPVVRTPTPVVTPVEPKEEVYVEPPPPAEYFGPPPFIVMSNEAVFRSPRATDKNIRLRIGEEKEGLKLLATDPPRSVLVSYDRGEYLVEVFPWQMAGLVNELGPRGPIPGLIVAERADELAPQPVPAVHADSPRAAADPVVQPDAEVDPSAAGESDPEEGGLEPYPGEEHDPALEPAADDPEPEPEPEPEPVEDDESEDDPEDPADDPEDDPEDPETPADDPTGAQQEPKK